MQPIDILLLQRALMACWAEDTAQDTPKAGVPSRGQCCVSSMVIQDYLGGAIVRGRTNLGGVHYWNQLDGGSWFDSTRAQFSDQEHIIEYVVHPPAEKYLFRETLEKYELLRGRVRAWLAAAGHPDPSADHEPPADSLTRLDGGS